MGTLHLGKRIARYFPRSKNEADAVLFGSHFIANPDLAYRLLTHAVLASPDKTTFYTCEEKGYTDYPSLSQAQ